MLIRSSQEEHVVSFHAPVAAYRVRGDGCVRMSDVRIAVHVVDGRSDGEGSLVAHAAPPGCQRISVAAGTSTFPVRSTA